MRVNPTYETASFKSIMKKLIDTPEAFVPDDLRAAFHYLLTPDLLPPEQIGALLIALHLRHVERKPELLTAAACLLRERALTAVVEGGKEDFVVDIVGTGGDGYNLFNVSTAAGIVAAGAGARVIKHGNKASTSSSGSADLLEALGCNFIWPGGACDTQAGQIIRRMPFSFILAPQYHPTLATIAPYRKALPFRTIFNVLGPLISPAQPKGMVLGVPQPELGLSFAKTLKDSGVVRALVVCGQEGIDEISCAGPTWVWELRDGRISESVLCPETFGFNPCPLQAVRGGGPDTNAETLEILLRSGENIPLSKRPLLDFVLMNASALLVVSGLADTYIDGVKIAYEAVISGKAWCALETFRDSLKVQAQALDTRGDSEQRRRH
ncbi:glycosyl transferase family, a/b domain-containing protein [Lentinula lateritia]|uniref:Glycosyl transferase family, a/b domain-containing protein n=1 Tax=Lentinula lateritia TaxID=40482 RepID=A0ABQ8V0C6_9AGAR|nr:glycosyl transferase family, a/b domain-containing protein [Lentinula lateritia]